MMIPIKQKEADSSIYFEESVDPSNILTSELSIQESQLSIDEIDDKEVLNSK